MPKISIIIPTHKNENAHKDLVEFLTNLSDTDLEIVTSTGTNRAHAMNQGAQKATHEFLWFVHADTKLTPNHIDAVKKSIQQHPDKIHYFDLAFGNDGPVLTKINSIGANIRSRIFGIPWGDQAFCLSKQLFQKLGQYDEDLSYGEDHILIWRAHQNKIKLQRIPLSITTSARQYKQSGWFILTAKRQFYWLKQAFPELITLIKNRLTS